MRWDHVKGIVEALIEVVVLFRHQYCQGQPLEVAVLGVVGVSIQTIGQTFREEIVGSQASTRPVDGSASRMVSRRVDAPGPAPALVHLVGDALGPVSAVISVGDALGPISAMISIRDALGPVPVAGRRRHLVVGAAIVARPPSRTPGRDGIPPPSMGLHALFRGGVGHAAPPCLPAAPSAFAFRTDRCSQWDLVDIWVRIGVRVRVRGTSSCAVVAIIDAVVAATGETPPPAAPSRVRGNRGRVGEGRRDPRGGGLIDASGPGRHVGTRQTTLAAMAAAVGVGGRAAPHTTTCPNGAIAAAAAAISIVAVSGRSPSGSARGSIRARRRGGIVAVGAAVAAFVAVGAVPALGPPGGSLGGGGRLSFAA